MHARYLTLLLPALACGGEPIIEPNPGDGTPRVALQVILTGLSNPTWLTAPPGDDRLFVLEQEGRIRIIRHDSLLTTPFLDISDVVLLGGERGLLGLAFHPDYATTGRFWVSYTNNAGNSTVAEFHVSADADVASPGAVRTLLSVSQPFPNHNGGQISFGPDGFLYLGLGDGGSAGDPLGHGQNPATLLGTITRLNVDSGAPAVWAWGLRNPWRFSHDPEAGTLIVADVGQYAWEEINIVPAAQDGHNFGWNVMEGLVCYAATSCNAAGFTMPVKVYPHGSGPDAGCSITGGAVYRGTAIPTLQGWYLYADYCGGWIRALWTGLAIPEFATDVELVPPGLGAITSFGTGSDGAMYVLTQDGTVRRIVAP